MTGPHRPSNQDRVYAGPGLGSFLVADGMGGPKGPEMGSGLDFELSGVVPLAEILRSAN